MKSQNTLSHEKISAHTPLTQHDPSHPQNSYFDRGRTVHRNIEKIPEKKVRADVLFLPLL